MPRVGLKVHVSIPLIRIEKEVEEIHSIIRVRKRSGKCMLFINPLRNPIPLCQKLRPYQVLEPHIWRILSFSGL